MKDNVDFNTIVENIRTYRPPDPDMYQPLEVSSDDWDNVSELAAKMIHDLESRAGARERSYFYMGPKTKMHFEQRLGEYSTMAHGTGGLELYMRPVRIISEPENVVLFIDPDAVTLAGSVITPARIIYAEVDWVDEEEV